MEATVDSLFARFIAIRASITKSWRISKFFRIASLLGGSIITGLSLRYIYITVYRKCYCLPDGVVGLPLIGNVLHISDTKWLTMMATNYGSCTSFMYGPWNGILVNEPYLAKTLYADRRTLNVMNMLSSLPELPFATANGKAWSERKKIIYSNLMITLKASYIETVTKTFIESNVFPVFDADIKNNKQTIVKPLFRALGFNIVLQACFGKELSTLKDPLWLQFDEKMAKFNANAVIQLPLMIMFGNSTFSKQIQKLLTGNNWFNNLDEVTSVIEEFTKSKKHDVVCNTDNENNENIQLFYDYIESYMDNTDGAKYTKRSLLSDIMIMLLGSTDTTYCTLSFALLLAAKYPKLQQQIFEELSNAFKNDFNNVELKNKGIFKIPKLRAFIHETLRIFPPVPATGIFRQIMDDGLTIDATEFDGKIYNVPKGAIPIINVQAIGLNPKYWITNYDEYKDKNINMEEVHLEFWIDDNGHFNKKLHSNSFFAFHTGKRDCIGQALAMKELVIVLAMIFMRYEVIAPHGTTDFEIVSHWIGASHEPTVGVIRLRHRK